MFKIVESFLQKRQGLNLFPWPSYDPCVVTLWDNLCDHFKLRESEVYADGELHQSRIGKYDVLIQEQTEKLLLDDYMIVPMYPVSAVELVLSMGAVQKVSGFVPSPLQCTDVTYGSADLKKCPEIYYSPFKIVKLMPTWEEYTLTLSSGRRSDLRRSMSKGFTLEPCTVSGGMLDWAAEHLKVRFKEDFDYAMAQLLFGYALHSVYPGRVPCYKISDHTGLAVGFGFVHHFFPEGSDAYATGHSYVFNSEVKGIGKAWIGLLVKQYTGTEFKYLNVGTGVYVGSNEDVQEAYKQEVSNHETCSVNVAIVDGETELYPPYYSINEGWTYADRDDS